MIIPPRFLDDIRARLTLSELIGRQIKVTRAGREFKACCPFHGEKTPSFTINDQKQFYHCFGCGAHGDVIGFAMRYNNLSFPDAVKQLAAQAGLTMPKADPQAIKREEKRKNLYDLMEETTRFFQNQLKGAPREYLLERGMNENMISGFRVGFAPVDGQALRKHLSMHKFSDKQMIEAGVLKTSTRGGEPYGFFRERIMFPVADKRGRTVAFGGRVLPEHLRAPSRGDFVPPKYINSGDTPLFDKGKMLYGESHARMAAREGKSIIVTEGYMDVIAAHQAGFTGAVAPMGTALTEEQIIALWRLDSGDEDTGGMKTPILCFDGDNAGRRAASRACERILPLLKAGQTARFAFMPDGEDPDTLIKSGGVAAFQNILDSALGLFDYLWTSHTLGRDFSAPEARASLTKTLHNEISKIADKELQSHYRRTLQDKVSETFFPKRQHSSAVKPKQHSAGHRPNLKKPSSLGLRRPNNNKQDIICKTLLAAALNYPALFDELEDMLGHLEITRKRLNALRQKLFMINDETPLSNLDHPDALHENLKKSGFEKEIGDILNKNVYVHASFVRPGAQADSVLVHLKTWMNDVNKYSWHKDHTSWQRAITESDQDLENKLVEIIKTTRS